jgi:SAM-dependent methyltransferase
MRDSGLSMNAEEYAIMYRVELDHWWYQGMQQITRALVSRWYPAGSSLRILDAGCGTGAAMTSYLAEYGQVTGFDMSEEAVRFSALRGARHLIRASVLQAPFADCSFDLVVSFDVLCTQSVPDDVAALSEFVRVLVPGGRALVRLPAYDWLRGRHDKAVHIRHRYTKEEVEERLTQAGFRVEHLSYANTFLFPMAALKRLAERFWPARVVRSDLTLPTGYLNWMLAAILSAEAPLVARSGLPFGLSVVAVGCKREED